MHSILTFNLSCANKNLIISGFSYSTAKYKAFLYNYGKNVIHIFNFKMPLVIL